ncbi:conserved hypothetical protein [Methylobacterium sp. 4-46]|uniref:hypothetical protein n=1 Tax=unclassified Methylobacterium TaxID=2615210 RepID=UPI000165C618|nr:MULTISPECIES: hypothetical protein [Methylobacterium]ACA14655.1 conserved hypothetical protein [Methylobacterium sp. 4-46]WFT80408.1 hypothetical protein QA634_00345 [Methylobacterium nodulans]
MRQILLASLLVLPLGVAAAEAPSPDATARFLAGMPAPPGAMLARLETDPAWKQHAGAFTAAFRTVETRQLGKIRAWSQANLTARRGTVYYLFSGPDFLYADSFFPDASTYVLAGLEPVGSVPDPAKLPRGSLASVTRSLRTSLHTVLNFSFFRTLSMRDDLRASPATGTLPVLYVFLARAGKTIRGVEFVHLDPQGTLNAGAAAGAGTPGVRITFARPGGPDQTLYYFSANLDNDGFPKSGLAPFCERLGIGDGLVKSASYLMHDGHFSEVRRFLLRQTSTLLQDDTGVPAAMFGPEWELRPYGRYTGPIGLFAGRYQPRLAELFRRQPPRPLGFGIGYRYRPDESSLILATKREAQVLRPTLE